MCPVEPYFFFVMWPRGRPPPSATRSYSEAISTLSEGIRSHFSLLFPSPNPVSTEANEEMHALFLTAWRELKRWASSWRHSIPLAQTAPEIGPVFVRRSIAEMQAPPSSRLFHGRLCWSVGSLKWREVPLMWLESLFDLFRDLGRLVSQP